MDARMPLCMTSHASPKEYEQSILIKIIALLMAQYFSRVKTCYKLFAHLETGIFLRKKD